MFQVGTKVKCTKPILVAHGDSREGLIGHVGTHRPNPSEKIANLVPVKFPESNLLWYLNPADLEKVD